MGLKLRKVGLKRSKNEAKNEAKKYPRLFD
jgi:hypothetical protein